MNKVLFIILAMFTITYSLRLVPFYIFDKIKINGKLKEFLSYIPYAALSAIVFPDIFTSINSEKIWIVLAMLFSIFWSLYKKDVIIPVFCSIIIIYIGKCI